MGKLREKPQFETTHPDFEQYALDFSTPEPELLVRLSRETHFASTVPSMLSGNLQGLLLTMISRMIHPETILEIGTFTGYSALCLAKGLTTDGLLHTIDIREADVQLAKSYFEKSENSHKIISHCGNAISVIETLDEEWDLVFIDADKPAYIDYFNLVFPRLRKNGIILADNVFFHGQVLDNPVSGKSAKGIDAFNKFVNDRNDIEKVMLTIRDGLYLIRKL